MKTLLVVIAVVAGVAALSVGVVVATSHNSTEVRIAAKRLDDGRIEVALQQRELDGSWGDRLLPTRRFIPASGHEGRWLTSSPVEVALPTPTPGPTLTVGEYAKWCTSRARGETADAGPVTMGEFFQELAEGFERSLDELRRIEPPAVLRDYHNSLILRLAVTKPLLEVVEEDTPEDADAALVVLYILTLTVEDEVDELPPDVRATLDEAGCIGTVREPSEVSTVTPTPTPIPTVEATVQPGPVVADGPPSWRTLQYVIARGYLLCGVRQTQPLFGLEEPDGSVVGFDIEFCKAIAAAVLGDATKVEYVDASGASTRFELLADAEVDVLIRTTAVTASRDRELGVDFAQPTFYTGQGFAVRKDSGYDSTSDMAEAVICVYADTPTERDVAEHFTEIGLTYHPTGGFSSDLASAFFSGRCDVLTADASDLASRISLRDDATDYKILPQIISREPLAPAVRDYDSEWKDVVNWVVHGLIAAEELGITQANVAQIAANPPNPEIARLLGVPYEGRAVSTLGFEAIGAQFIQRAIAAVGNYGEIYERTIGDHLPRACTLNALAIDQSVDCPPGLGGIMYALPYR